jgi:hypothetical protein
MTPTDQDRVQALRDHADTLDDTNPAVNASFDRDIAGIEEARALAYKIENGEASDEEKASADIVHPTVKTRYGL